MEPARTWQQEQICQVEAVSWAGGQPGITEFRVEANKVFGYSWGEKAPKTPVSLDAAHLLETDFVIFQFPPFFTLGVRDLNFGRCLEDFQGKMKMKMKDRWGSLIPGAGGEWD